MATLVVPTPLRKFADGQATISVSSKTVEDALAEVVEAYPALKRQLFDEKGDLRPFVNLFVNDSDIRMDAGLATPISDRDRIEIVPAIAGGEGPRKDAGTWRAELEGRVVQLDPTRVNSSADVLRLDVRTVAEWEGGHLPEARHLDRGFLELRIETMAPDRKQPIVCYCESGTRSLFAASTLAELGYQNVSSLAGGIQRWRSEGFPVVIPGRLSEGQQRRYQRHLSIPEVGVDGQLALSGARVIIVGAGGLGCPVALYLAAAGVGTLALVDDDVVDESNLQRQVLYRPDDIGRPKVEVAREALTAFNPLIQVRGFGERLDLKRADELFSEYDLVVDATDNFRSRYLINDAAIGCGKPVVHGAVYRFDGQISVFAQGDGPCYRCFSAEAPPPDLAPSCVEGGVLGVLPGTVGLIMATEAIKLLLGIGDSLSGRMILYDALSARFRTLSFGRRDDCAVCRSPVQPSIRLAALAD